MWRTSTQSRFLDNLVSDCITFGLKEKEALEYIKVKFGKEIKPRSYETRKSKLLSEDSMQLWLDHFTRIGYLSNHRKQVETLERIQDDALRQLFIETSFFFLQPLIFLLAFALVSAQLLKCLYLLQISQFLQTFLDLLIL